MNFKRRIKDSNTGFQMGPMLDIIFILLIQFMVATMFANREDWFQISVPAAVNGSDQQIENTEVILNLRENGELYLDFSNGTSTDVNSTGEQMLSTNSWGADNRIAQATAQQQLASRLDALRQRNKDLKVIIRADANVPHGRVVSLLDICAEVSISNVAFSTQQPKNR